MERIFQKKGTFYLIPIFKVKRTLSLFLRLLNYINEVTYVIQYDVRSWWSKFDNGVDLKKIDKVTW